MIKNGFTLAEVLITLVIIGIIAAMTIPNLINRTDEQEKVVAVKKSFSVLSQAYKRLIADMGEITTYSLGSNNTEATENFGKLITPYFNTQQVCGMAANEGCFPSPNKLMSGEDGVDYDSNSNYFKMRLSDGSSVLFSVYSVALVKGTSLGLDSTFGWIMVDINGDKGPNTMGKDNFSFWITKYGIVPFGSPFDNDHPLENCRTLGFSCAAWVVTKGNMDYLRKEVSW